MSNSVFSSRVQILEKSLKVFVDRLGFVPKIGAELEFYLLRDVDKDAGKKVDEKISADSSEVSDFISDLTKNSPSNLIYQIEKEKGASQIELKFDFVANLSFFCAEILRAKEIIMQRAKDLGFVADFAAQIFPDDCGNALQLNFSLHDEVGKNLFIGDEGRELLKKSMAGILYYLKQMMVFCVADTKDFARFDVDLNRNLHKKGKFVAPTKICCGVDNRSAALRFFGEKSQQNRIEFRLPCAQSDPYPLCAALLFAVMKACENDWSLNDDSLIYGNAFDDGKLQILARDFDEAVSGFVGGELEGFVGVWSESL